MAAETPLPLILGMPHGSPTLLGGGTPARRHEEDELRVYADVGLPALLDLPVRHRQVGLAHPYECDPDRDPVERGPDGVVPLESADGEPLFRVGEVLDEDEISRRVRTLHKPYHAALREARAEDDVVFHLECLSFEPAPRVRDPDRDRLERSDRYRRPQVCLSNHGDAAGRPRDGGITTCPQEDLAALRDLFQARGYEVLLNNPSPAGYSTLRHGKRWYAGLERAPVCQLTLRQDMWLDGPRGLWDPRRGDALRADLEAIFRDFVDYLVGADIGLLVESVPPRPSA